MVKNPPAIAGDIRDAGQEDALEEGTATHCSILAWRIPWTEEPGRLRFIGLQRGGRICIYLVISWRMFLIASKLAAVRLLCASVCWFQCELESTLVITVYLLPSLTCHNPEDSQRLQRRAPVVTELTLRFTFSATCVPF